MKVLQVNNVYNFGSTGKITADIHHALQKKQVESIVCYGRRDLTQEENVHKVCGEFYSHVEHFRANATGVMYGGCELSTRRLIRIIQREKPDVVHLQCLNGYFVNIYKLLTWLKNQHIKTVLTLHAEFMYTANCGHALECEKWKTGCGNCPRLKAETGSYFLDRTDVSWRRMQKAFAGFEDDLVVVSVSPWLMERAKQSPMLKDMQHRVVLNGLNTDVFHPVPTEEVRRKYGTGKIIFHATPWFNGDKEYLKGGYYLLKLAERMPDVTFLVAGLHEEGLQVPDNVTLLGKIEDQNLLRQYYAAADLTLLTSKRETFSMVCAESLCCGTPVVGFEAGAPEMIALPDYSAFIPYGEIDQLEAAVKRVLTSSWDRPEIAKQAAERYANEQMTMGYLDIYNELAASKK